MSSSLPGEPGLSPTQCDDTIVIRPMQSDDVEAVHSIDVRSFSLPWPAHSYQFEIDQNPASMPLVAELRQSDGTRRVVGMVVTWLIVDEAHIATIAVEPEYRRSGIGRQLLITALHLAVQHQAVQATLEVRANNLAAQELYRKFGFEVVGVRPRYYSDNNEDALIMTASGLSPQVLSRLEESE